MNERAKQLALQSGLETQLWLNGTDPAEEAAVQKFTELIVRECAEVALRQQTERDIANVTSTNPAKDFAYALIAHFGVK